MFRKGPHSIDLAVAVLGHKGLKAIAQTELHFDQFLGTMSTSLFACEFPKGTLHS